MFRNQRIGSLTLCRPEEEPFAASEQELLDRLSAQIAPVVQNMRVYQRARRQAYRTQQIGLSGVRHVPGFDWSEVAVRPSGWESAAPSRDIVLSQEEQPNSLPGLLMGVAYSLRTPLAAIKGYSNALLQPGVTWTPEVEREFLETIDLETDRLDRAVAELLLPAQDEAGGAWLNIGTYTLRSLLDAAELELAAGNRQRPVEFRCQPGLAPVAVDCHKLVRIIAYLVECAGDIAHPGAALRVEGCWRGGRPGISIGTVGQEARHLPATIPLAGGREASYGYAAGDEIGNDLRVIVASNLLQVHGLSLGFGPGEDRAEIFWVPLPHASPLATPAGAGPGPMGGPPPWEVGV